MPTKITIFRTKAFIEYNENSTGIRASKTLSPGTHLVDDWILETPTYKMGIADGSIVLSHPTAPLGPGPAIGISNKMRVTE